MNLTNQTPREAVVLYGACSFCGDHQFLIVLDKQFKRHDQTNHNHEVLSKPMVCLRCKDEENDGFGLVWGHYHWICGMNMSLHDLKMSGLDINTTVSAEGTAFRNRDLQAQLLAMSFRRKQKLSNSLRIVPHENKSSTEEKEKGSTPEAREGQEPPQG